MSNKREVTVTVPVEFAPGASPNLLACDAARLTVYHDQGRGFYASAWPVQLTDGGWQCVLMDGRNLTARLTGVERFNAGRLERFAVKLRAQAPALAEQLAAGTLTGETLRGAL